MSIVQTVEATPSRVFAIFCALLDSPSGIKKTDQDMLYSNNLRKDGKTSIFANTYNECKKLGIVIEKEGCFFVRKVKDNRDITNEEKFYNFIDKVILTDSDKGAEYSKKFLMTTAWFLNPLYPLNFKNSLMR